MIRTSNILVSIDDVPDTWIFEHYLSIPQRLDGREIKFKSVFNPAEKTPSMFVYSTGVGKYKFKDFSSGFQGNAVELVSKLFDLTYSKAVIKIKTDYAEWLKTGLYVSCETKEHSKFKVTDYNGRKWTNLDAKYWMSFCIPSSTLERFNVIPLANYTMSNGTEDIVMSGHYIYGYLRKDGLLYKIYQPKNTNKKFIKVRNYTQGIEQLTYTKPNLVIHSSLKDIMAFEQLTFKTIECIAPDSENSMISETVMWDLIDKYDKVITIFDNDEAGKKAVEKYTERFGISGFTVDLEKDVSDSMRKYGKDAVKAELVPLLMESIHTNKRCKETSTLV